MNEWIPADWAIWQSTECGRTWSIQDAEGRSMWSESNACRWGLGLSPSFPRRHLEGAVNTPCLHFLTSPPAWPGSWVSSATFPPLLITSRPMIPGTPYHLIQPLGLICHVACPLPLGSQFPLDSVTRCFSRFSSHLSGCLLSISCRLLLSYSPIQYLSL